MRLHVATCKDDSWRCLLHGFLQNRHESRTATCFESHAGQIEQDDRFVSGVLTARSFENLLHYDVEPNASSDIMIVSDIDLPSKPSSKYIVTSHSLQPESFAQSSPTSDSILCTAHALLETCCHMKAKLLIVTITYQVPGRFCFMSSCAMFHTR